MDEEKHKFIIPFHERRKPGTVTIDPTSPTDDAPSPLDTPRIHHLDDTYPQTAHLRDARDHSPSYPESGSISVEPSVPKVAARHAPPPFVAAPAPDPERHGAAPGWMQRLDNVGQVEGRPRKTILGLTVFRFWAAVALGVIIVGVAIAVGLALGLANRYV